MVWKIYTLSWQRFAYVLDFTEEIAEIAFKHFLFVNITKFRFFLYFCDHTDIKKWKSFKDYFLRLSHTLTRNLTKLVYVWK